MKDLNGTMEQTGLYNFFANYYSDHLTKTTDFIEQKIIVVSWEKFYL